MSKFKEQTLQEWCADFLNRLPILWSASAGGMRVSINTAKKMKRAGYKKGFPDIFIYLSKGCYHGMAIELKLGSYPTPEQINWQKGLSEAGYYAIIVPRKLNFQEAYQFVVTEIERYMALK